MSPNGAALTSLRERRERSLGPAYRLFYDQPMHLVRGEGVWLTDGSGTRYLDLYNNVPHVGHCHPHVVAAINEQAARLTTHTRYLHEGIVTYAERLLATFPAELSTAMFSCSGSEANELAIRIARAATGGTGIIVLEQAYHGTSCAAFEMSTEDNPRELWPPHLAVVPAPDPYRGRHAGADAGLEYAAHVAEAVDVLRNRGVKPAAFVVDTIASSSGVVAPPRGYLKRAAEIVRRAGGLFVADEVQPGFGRTGKGFWGFAADNVVPDIVTLGKPMGNGYPLAATVARRPLVEAFASRFGYFNTFGGNPVAAAAGLAVLDVLENDRLQDNALDVGRYLKAELTRRADRLELIGDVRGDGLFLAVDLVVDRQTKEPATDAARRVVNTLRSLGVLTNVIGPHANILKLRPPMTFSIENADFFLERFDRALSELQ